MSFTTFNEKSISQKQILLEIDTGEDYDIFINHVPGIWKWKIKDVRENIDYSCGYGACGYGSYGYAGTGTLGSNDIEYNIGSLNVDGDAYLKVASLALLYADDGSAFYYDVSTFTFYIKFEDLKQPWEFTVIAVGITSGYSLVDNGAGNVYGGIYYPIKIQSVPSLKFAADSLRFKIMAFNGGAFMFDNTDGAFDSFAQSDIFGQEARLLYGGIDLDYADYLQLFTGFIDDFSYDKDKFKLMILDIKSRFDLSVPVEYADASTYSDISDDYENIEIPLAYGPITGAVAICTNDDEAPAPADYSFLLCYPYHDISAITTVYVEGVVKVPSATDLAACTFTLDAGDYTPGDDVTADFTGYTDDSTGAVIENALDVIKDLLLQFYSITYSTDTYDIGEWTTERANASNIKLYINETKKLKSILEDILNSIRGIMYTQGDGKISFKRYDESGAAETTIEADEIKVKNISHNKDDAIAGVVVEYGYDHGEGEYKQVYNRDNEAAFFTKYKRKPTETYETLLQTKANAQSYADDVIDYHSVIRPRVTWEEKMAHSNLYIYDIVDVYINRYEKTLLGRAHVLILSKTINLKKFTTTFMGRVLSSSDITEYGLVWADGGKVLLADGTGRFLIRE